MKDLRSDVAMSVVKRDKRSSFQGRKIVWMSFLRLDIDFRTSIREILRHLAKQGHDTTLIAIRSGKKIQIKDLGVKLILVPLRYVPVVSPLMFAVIVFFFLPFYIVVSKPDFIITEPDISIFWFIPAIIFSKFKKVKLVLDVRSTPIDTVAFPGFLMRARAFLITFSFGASILMAKRFFDGITIITPLMKRQICKRFNINPKRLGVWSSGVSTWIFDPENYASRRKELKRKLGLSEKFIVFYHGWLSMKRGLVETIEAMSIVKCVCPDVVFFLLGAGSQARAHLEKLIQKNGLKENVMIHDAVDYSEVPSYIAMCDVGIVPLLNLPYWKFQCPLKLLEYLAMKKVVIVTDIPANRSVVGKEKCGIYVSPATPTKIAKSIIYAYNNRENLEEWGASGWMIVNEKYTWEKVARDLESYLSSI